MRALSLVLMLLLGCALFELAAIRSSFPPVDGTLSVEGTDGPITIRDALGVPHVRATTERDAWFGQGFVHGQDRYYQADLLRHLAYGDLTEWLGEGPANFDAFMRTLDLRGRAEVYYEALDVETRAVLDAYADGMNAGRGTLENLPIEYRLMKVEPQPWAPMDAYGVLAMQSWNLETNAAQEVSACWSFSRSVIKPLVPGWSSPIAAQREA